MTREEAITLIDELMVCIKEHPIVADWLVEIADRKTESDSEKPNNCEHITEDGVTCAKYLACDDCLDNSLNKVKGSERLVKGSEQTDCQTCKWWSSYGYCVHRECKGYEPQTDWHYDEQDATWYPYKHEDEPQTEDEILREQRRAFMGIVEQTEERCEKCVHFMTNDMGKIWCIGKKTCEKFEPRSDTPQTERSNDAE